MRRRPGSDSARQRHRSSRTTTSIALTWAPATDNIGVAGYGVYNGADLVSTTAGTTGIVGGLVCGTNYTLAVDAFDGSGNSSPRSAVMVSTLDCSDTSAPTVAATAPTNGATVSGMVSEVVNATDNVGVTKIEFLRDGVMYGSDTTAPYSASFNTTTVPNGSHTFGARAYDAAGNTGTAANVTVTVANVAADTVAPTVASTAPTNGATVSATINQVVNATDNVGVTKIEFLRDGVMYGRTPRPVLDPVRYDHDYERFPYVRCPRLRRGGEHGNGRQRHGHRLEHDVHTNHGLFQLDLARARRPRRDGRVLARTQQHGSERA